MLKFGECFFQNHVTEFYLKIIVLYYMEMNLLVHQMSMKLL